MGTINCEFVFGPGARPPGKKFGIVSECLIKVYATENIKKDSELLLEYGPAYFE